MKAIWFALLVALVALASQANAIAGDEAQASVFAPDNLVAWCIVPFDAKKRGPVERAEMLDRLKIKRLAYDWRDEHVPTFDLEIETLAKHGIELTAFWFPATTEGHGRTILDTLKKHEIKTQLWVSLNDPAPNSKEQSEKVAAAVRMLRPIAEEAKAIGCTVGLYNHGGWFGEPEHQLAVLEALKLDNVGLVYNFHHGHDHIARFAKLWPLMQPHLLAVNINGMAAGGERAGKKILAIDEGDQELAMLKVISKSGWRGPVGILGHRAEMDAEVQLRQNLEGLAKLRGQIE